MSEANPDVGGTIQTQHMSTFSMEAEAKSEELSYSRFFIFNFPSIHTSLNIEKPQSNRHD